MQRLFIIIELFLMATPSVFPALPFEFGILLYLAAGVLALLAIIDWARTKDWWRMPWPTLGQLSPVQSRYMPLLELRELAGRSGWNLSDPSLQLTDLEQALNEAGVNGLIDFFARPADDHLFDDFIKSEARRKINKAEWADLEVGGRWIDLRCNDNFEITLVRKGRRYGERAFADVHVDRKQARRWLRRDAPEYRGRNDAIHRSGSF